MKKTQVLVIHGGNTFKNEKDYLKYLRTRKISLEKRVRWYPVWLESALGKKFDVIAPRMPLQDNAKYRDWEILFRRYVFLLKGRFILIGSSLGGIFLAKYLSENKLPKKALSVYIICPPFNNSLPKDDLVGGFNLRPDLFLIEKNCRNLYLLFSENDDVVPVSNAEKYRKKLPGANLKIYKGKNGHFYVPKFPEIIKLIKSDLEKV